MKKKYTKPQMDIMDMGSEQPLLSASCESSDYWKCPEPPEEGCENSYWCGK